MTGSVIMEFGRGWACSNEATYVIEKNLITLEDGSRVSKHTHTIRAMAYHNVISTVVKGDRADCVFKDDETGEKKSYNTEVSGITKEMLILKIINYTDNQQEIIKKIKGGY